MFSILMASLTDKPLILNENEKFDSDRCEALKG